MSLPDVSPAPVIPAPIFYDMCDTSNSQHDPDHHSSTYPASSNAAAHAAAHSTVDVNQEPNTEYRLAESRYADEEHMETLDAVYFDKVSAANRFAHPRRRHVVTERHVPSASLQTRVGRKTIASPAARSPRRKALEKPRISDYRSFTDSSDDSYRRDRDRDHDGDYDHRDEIPPSVDSDFMRWSRVDIVKKSGSPGKETVTELPRGSRIRYSKPEARARRQRKDVTKQPSQLHKLIVESPFFLQSRQSNAASPAAESRSYNAYTDTLQNEARGDGGGLRTIVELLRDSEGNPIVIEKAALVIGILSENDAATRDAFGQFAAVQTLIQCLTVRIPAKFDRTVIVKNVTFALASLLRDSPRNLRLFEMFDGPYKMGKVAASERYENKPDVPKYALRALSELKYHPHSSESQTNHVLTNSSTTGRTVMYVLRAMSLHEYRTEIQECGLDALRTLLLRSGREVVDGSLLQESATAAGTAFKLHHKESVEVNWQCLTLLCDVEGLHEEGGILVDLDMECMFGAVGSLIIEARQVRDKEGAVYQGLVDLLKRALQTIERMGHRRGDFTEQAVEAGAAEAILDALDFFGGDRQEVDRIQSILRTLLDCDEGRFRLGSARAARAVLEGIETRNKVGSSVLSS